MLQKRNIYFLQVVPTDQEFRRAQQQGGGGGGGQGAESSALVTIQKDVISATWKLRNRQDTAEPQNFCPLMVAGEVDGAKIVGYKGSKIELFCGSYVKNLKFKGNEFS